MNTYLVFYSYYAKYLLYTFKFWLYHLRGTHKWNYRACKISHSLDERLQWAEIRGYNAGATKLDVHSALFRESNLKRYRFRSFGPFYWARRYSSMRTSVLGLRWLTGRWRQHTPTCNKPLAPWRAFHLAAPHSRWSQVDPYISQWSHDCENVLRTGKLNPPRSRVSTLNQHSSDVLKITGQKLDILLIGYNWSNN